MCAEGKVIPLAARTPVVDPARVGVVVTKGTFTDLTAVSSSVSFRLYP